MTELNGSTGLSSFVLFVLFHPATHTTIYPGIEEAKVEREGTERRALRDAVIGTDR